MKNKSSHTFVLIALALIAALGNRGAAAQNVDNGPYYATPSWDQKLACSTRTNCPRFIILSDWNNEAVLDRETGLVWQVLQGSIAPDNWFGAAFNCINLNAGGRTGWRLPTIQELLSLVDRSRQVPSLPGGHPFGTVQSSNYHSATNWRPPERVL